jgi:hypothetical protein
MTLGFPFATRTLGGRLIGANVVLPVGLPEEATALDDGGGPWLLHSSYSVGNTQRRRVKAWGLSFRGREPYSGIRSSQESNKEPTLPPVLSDPRWIQFRRLLLGTVIEALLKAKIAVDFPSIEIAFDAESDFRVPRFDNYMRFKGGLKATVTAAPSPAAQANLVRNLKAAWPSLLDALDLPVGDKLTSERNEIEVVVDDRDRMTVRFDLEAD